MRTLVVGATGLLGLEIARRLSESDRVVRCLVRPSSAAEKRQQLAALGAELVEGDLKDAASLDHACADVTAIISTASSTFSRQEGDSIATVDEQGQIALVEAAERAGVEHFVFVSFRDNPRIKYPLALAKRAVEARLRRSRVAWTILQASYFMEVWLTPALGFDPAAGTVRIAGEGRAPISWVSYRDVARAAVAVLAEPDARDTAIEFGGPQALSPLEVVRIFEAAGAGEIAVEHVPTPALEAQMQAATDPLQQSFAGLMLQYASGDDIDPAASHRLLPFERTSVRSFVTASLSGATGR